MKKVLILFAFVFAAGMASAQSKTCTKAEKAACAKSGKVCTKSKASASTDGETKVASAMSVADIAAENDETIERKVCGYSGNVSYYKKNVCEKSGKVSMTEVQFDEETESFVNTSPKDTEMEAKVVKTASETKAKAKCCKGKKSKSCSKTKEGA